MTDVKLTLRTYHERKRHGDRATVLSESTRYEIVVTRDGKDVVLHTFDQHNARECFVRDIVEFESEVQTGLARSIEALGLTEYTIEHYHPRMKETWHKKSASQAVWDNRPRTP